VLASLAMLARESALRVAAGGSAPPHLFRCAPWLERARRRRALCDVDARLLREARLAASGILLAVAQKRIVAQIEAIGPLPRNVEWLHHSGPTCRGLAAAV
jgi:hypothetical protein